MELYAPSSLMDSFWLWFSYGNISQFIVIFGLFFLMRKTFTTLNKLEILCLTCLILPPFIAYFIPLKELLTHFWLICIFIMDSLFLIDVLMFLKKNKTT